MPILLDINSKQLSVLNILINKVARSCKGIASYRWHNAKLLLKCGWLNGTHLLYYSALCFIHKVNFEALPVAISELYYYREGGRRVRCPEKSKISPKTKITRDQLLEKWLLLYKKIPDIFKTTNQQN